MKRQSVVSFTQSESTTASVGTMNDRASKLHRFTRRPLEAELELRHLRVFVALVEHGSMTAASRALGFAQSTVSEALAALERALGAKVVKRQPGAQAALLTTAGHALLPHAREVLAAVDQTRAAVAEMVTSARGVVEIVANESISTYVLPEVLAHVRGRWPNTRFPVSIAPCGTIRRGVDDGSFDVGLFIEHDVRRIAQDKPSNALTRFADRHVVAPRVPLIIFAHPSHPVIANAARQPLPRSSLSGLTLFVGDDAAGEFHALLERFFRSDGLPGPRLQPTGSVEGVKRGVISDRAALGILPLYVIAEELRTEQVAAVQLRPAPSQLRLVAMITRSRPRHPSIGALLESICRAFAKDASGDADPRQESAG